MSDKILPPAEQPSNPLAMEPPGDWRTWQIVLGSLGLFGIWLIPVLGTIAIEHYHAPTPTVVLLDATAMLLVIGIGVVAAAWTIGGPGFLLLRAAASLSLSMFFVWSSLVFVSWFKREAPPNPLASDCIAFCGIWLGLAYLTSLLFAGLGYRWGWRLGSDETWHAPTTQYGMVDLLLIVSFAALAFAVAAWAIPYLSAADHRRWRIGVQGVLDIVMFVGAPNLIGNAIAFGCSVCSTMTIGCGLAAVAAVASITAVALTAYFRGPRDFVFFTFIPAALLQYLFIVCGIGVLRACLAGAPSPTSPLSDEHWNEVGAK